MRCGSLEDDYPPALTSFFSTTTTPTIPHPLASFRRSPLHSLPLACRRRRCRLHSQQYSFPPFQIEVPLGTASRLRTHIRLIQPPLPTSNVTLLRRCLHQSVSGTQFDPSSQSRTPSTSVSASAANSALRSIATSTIGSTAIRSCRSFVIATGSSAISRCAPTINARSHTLQLHTVQHTIRLRIITASTRFDSIVPLQQHRQQQASTLEIVFSSSFYIHAKHPHIHSLCHRNGSARTSWP